MIFAGRVTSWAVTAALICVAGPTWANGCDQILARRPAPESFYLMDRGIVVPLARIAAGEPVDLHKLKTIYYYTEKQGVTTKSVSSVFHIKLLLERSIKNSSTDQPGSLSLERREWDDDQINQLSRADQQRLQTCRQLGWTIEEYEHFHSAPDMPRDNGCFSRVFHRGAAGGFNTLATNDTRHKFAFGLDFEENYVSKVIAFILSPTPARAQTIDSTLKRAADYDYFVSRIEPYQVMSSIEVTRLCFPVSVPIRSNISSITLKMVDFDLDSSKPNESSVTVKVK